ncbi:uncharacterized protein A4U43_C02F21760 [Asparagus officinalis]|uniref:MPN domain-containing protein n=1 Tax=Asparagus officinalis TaxID=4686 RepID=A0A5P1FLW1_ASPOF|nr:AMSH-like ubiquitin thioesterase 3 [Asparagus officinalis]ONK78723.1 uncharacterized protein A4U43_C02F21760 [Asparagus officinalis]
MAPSMRSINIRDSARKIEVDNRISIRYYSRIAENLLRQARIYREEKNLIDLYIILLRYSSLMCDTIPSHRDYQALVPKEKTAFKKKLLDVISELESLKPIVTRQVEELNREIAQSDGGERVSYSSSPTWKQIPGTPSSEQQPTKALSQSFQKHNNVRNHVTSPQNLQLDRQFQKLSLSLPYPKEETLSRHSILGPTGLRSQWTAPITGIRVQYPSNTDLAHVEIPGVKKDGDYGTLATEEGDARGTTSDLESVLSLDDGSMVHCLLKESWLLCGANLTQDNFSQLNIRQPSSPPVLAQVQPQLHPSKVADPRPGPAKVPMDGMLDSKEYQKLHIPVKMMDCFLRLAEMNTMKNLETCGVLAGSLKNRMFYVTTLIIPKQESTSDSCQTTDEEEIFNVQDQRSLFPLGWIHTHPTQTCFMSSIDLHTHYSYQIMLPEAIAIVMAPTDTSRTQGIFHLSDPGGVSVIRNCQERGFHPHEEPPDGSPIYEHCSHVLMNENLKFDVVDLRNK